MNDHESDTSSDLGLLPPEAARRLVVDQGASVFITGDPARGLFQVESGRIRMVRHAIDGSTATLHVARDGETFAEASLFAERYHCDAVADLPSTVLHYEKKLVLAHLASHPERASRWITHLSRQVQALRAQVALLGLNTARERILVFLRTACDGGAIVRLDRPWKAIASELGLTHEALYRTLAALEREGLIERDSARRSVRLTTL